MDANKHVVIRHARACPPRPAVFLVVLKIYNICDSICIVHTHMHAAAEDHAQSVCFARVQYVIK